MCDTGTIISLRCQALKRAEESKRSYAKVVGLRDELLDRTLKQKSGTLIVDLRERSLIRVSHWPMPNLVQLIGEDIEDE
jgi:hypothetical protein